MSGRRKRRASRVNPSSDSLSSWHHGRLLRRALLICSLLTLSGLHVPGDTLPAGWRVVRPMPLTLGLAGALSNAAAIVTAANTSAIFNGLLYGLSFWYSILVMVHLQYHRRHFQELLRRVEELEEATSVCRRAGDHTVIKWNNIVIIFSSALTSVVWSTSFVTGKWEHPHYMFPILVPEAMQGQDWFWVITIIQLAIGVFLLISQVTFDLLQIGLMDAVALFLDRLSRYTRCYLAQGGGSSANMSVTRRQAGIRDEEHFDTTKVATARGYRQGATHPMENHTNAPNHLGSFARRDWEGHALAEYSDTSEHQPTFPAASAPKLSDPGADLESGLVNLAETHRCVGSLAADAAAVVSVPTLLQHASITFQLLVGLYVAIGLFLDSGGNRLRAVSFVLFLVMGALRLAAACAAGSRLIAGGERLSTALATSRWPRGISLPVWITLQMLLEQTRRPLGFDGYGIFVTRKSTMLSLLGFVLTYFVIMVQMSV